MMKGLFTVSEDNKGDAHISLPFLDPKLPYGLTVVKSNQQAIVDIVDLNEVITAHQENNQALVNIILSKHLKDII